VYLKFVKIGEFYEIFKIRKKNRVGTFLVPGNHKFSSLFRGYCRVGRMGCWWFLQWHWGTQWHYKRSVIYYTGHWLTVWQQLTNDNRFLFDLTFALVVRNDTVFC